MSENLNNNSVEKENSNIDFEEVNLDANPYFMPKRNFDLSGRDLIFTFLLLLCSLIFTFLGLWGGFRGGFTVSSLAIFGVTSLYVYESKAKIKPFFVFCGLLSVVLSFVFGITSNGSVRWWSFVLIVLLSAMWFYSLVSDKKENKLSLLGSVFYPVFDGALGNLPATLTAIFTGKEKGRAVFGKALIGVALAIPVLIVVVPLLISSDEAFSGMALRLFEDLGSGILKVIVAVIIAPFLISYSFSLSKHETKLREKSEFKGIENAVTISFLSVISLCYLLYLFSQLAYFFSAFSGFLPENYKFTVSEYARRGFFEMCIIAAINYLIIFLCMSLSKKENGKMCIPLRILCTFIGFFTLIIIATALSKMVLYISSFGMTELRITTSSFMLFLSVTFIALILRIYIPKIPVLKVSLITASIVLSVLGILNVNNVIANYNYNAYMSKVLKTIDVETIYELNEEGIPYLIKLTEDTDYSVSLDAEKYLKKAIHLDNYYDFDYKNGIVVKYEKNYTPISQFSIARHRAFKELDKYITKNPDILSEEREEGEVYSFEYY